MKKTKVSQVAILVMAAARLFTSSEVSTACTSMPSDRAPLTDCDWHFSLESTSQNTAGLSPVEMLRRGKALESSSNSKGGLESSLTASVKDQVQFYAQYRTDHDANVPASGDLQIIRDGKIVGTFPLKVGHDVASGASTFFLDIQWEPSGSQYLGKNTVKFIVKIGSAELTSVGEFALTR